jgi:hypothetical protein
MQRGHDDFERRLVLVLGMRIDGNAATVVSDGNVALGVERDLDEGGVAGYGLVHRVVDHFREEMVKRLVVGTADIHAGPAAHRFEAFEDLDGRCVVIARRVGGLLGALRGAFRRRRSRAVRFGCVLNSGEEIAVVVHGHPSIVSVGKPNHFQ